jgi:hypothetical protein
MTIIVTTESGSVYTFDLDKMTYQRAGAKPLADPDFGTPLGRKDETSTLYWVPAIKVGKSMNINNWPGEDGILTTRVKSIEVVP